MKDTILSFILHILTVILPFSPCFQWYLAGEAGIPWCHVGGILGSMINHCLVYGLLVGDQGVTMLSHIRAILFIFTFDSFYRIQIFYS